MRLFKSALFAVATASLAGVGCGDDAPRGEVREWRATDHAQPAQPSEGQSAGTTPGEPGAEPGAEPAPEIIARAAAALYDARCASCHGAAGDGRGPEAPVAAMPNFGDAAFHTERTDADLARAIRMGQGLMPAFGGELNDRGIQALVTHIRSLRPAG